MSRSIDGGGGGPMKLLEEREVPRDVGYNESIAARARKRPTSGPPARALGAVGTAAPRRGGRLMRRARSQAAMPRLRRW